MEPVGAPACHATYGRASLRDGVASLKARIKSLYLQPVARSTFADANHRRPASFHEALFALMYRDAATGRRYVFFTNHFKLAARTIADIYRERWQIEIFCRFIKQNLKIKAFIGNSENPVLTQIYKALIVYRLLCYLKFMCNLNITLQNCIRILQLNLFRTCTRQELFQPPETITANIYIILNS